VAGVYGNISQLQIYTLTLFKNDNDFFDLETINSEYFRTHTSRYIHARDSLNRMIRKRIDQLLSQPEEQDYPALKSDLSDIDSALQKYNTSFMALEALVFQKGFKDYGFEGKMRFYAHELEKPSHDLEIVELLFLRRNEKDFLLRLDSQYIDHFNQRATALFKEMKHDSLHKAGTIRYLEQYQYYFNALASINKKIGLSSLTGLRHELNQLTTHISTEFLALSQLSYELSSKSKTDASLLFIILLSTAVMFSIVATFWISKRLSDPIAQLSGKMKTMTDKKSYAFIELKVMRNTSVEINTLVEAFNSLMQKTSSQMKEIKNQSLLLKKRNRELKKLNRELDNFVYSTAHDLRSPLTSLLGLLNLIKYENKQQELEPYFDKMRNSIQRLENFIGQIVSYSKNNKLGIENNVVDFTSLINGILEDHQFIEGNDRIRKEVTFLRQAPFASDNKRLRIIFNNLVSNALRYYNPNEKFPFIRVTLDITEKEATLSFTDNGIGISQEHVSKIFDMFYRANFNSQGSGLGLFIMRETIKKLNGEVSVISEVNVGTSFRIVLPNEFKEAKVAGISAISHVG
jgi:signal transduction histidine kinase